MDLLFDTPQPDAKSVANSKPCGPIHIAEEKGSGPLGAPSARILRALGVRAEGLQANVSLLAPCLSRPAAAI